MKKLVYFTAVIAALVAAAVPLNPSPEKHRAEIKRQVAQHSQLAGLLGLGSLTAFVSEYHSVGVASYTLVNDKVVSIGAFGMVTLVD